MTLISRAIDPTRSVTGRLSDELPLYERKEAAPTAVRFSEFGCNARKLPPPKVVITGLDPVIHAVIGMDPGTRKRVDDRIKSGHDGSGSVRALSEAS